MACLHRILFQFVHTSLHFNIARGKRMLLDFVRFHFNLIQMRNSNLLYLMVIIWFSYIVDKRFSKAYAVFIPMCLIVQLSFSKLCYSGTNVTYLNDANNLVHSSTTQQYFTFIRDQVISFVGYFYM